MHPGEQFYPEGVHWGDPIARGTLPDLLSKAAVQYGARPAIEFRDRPIGYAELERKEIHSLTGGSDGSQLH
jgi:long-chain acyl-CoA synthetase